MRAKEKPPLQSPGSAGGLFFCSWDDQSRMIVVVGLTGFTSKSPVELSSSTKPLPSHFLTIDFPAYVDLLSPEDC